MKLKKHFLIIEIILLLFLLYVKRCESYILNINVIERDDLFFFLYKSEHLLATNYYNFKPSYFFSFKKGVIKINLEIDYKENNLVKKKSRNQEILAKANKSSINLLTHLNVHKKQLSKLNNEYMFDNNEESHEIFNTLPSELGNDAAVSEISKTLNTSAKEEILDNSNDEMVESPKSNNLYLVLITANQWLNYIKLKNKLEPSLLNEDNYIFTSHFNSVKRYPLYKGTLKKTIKIYEKNRYMLFLINSNKLKMTVKGNIMYYDDITKHLSYDFVFIPHVLLCTAFILIILMAFMSLFLLRYKLKSDIFMLLNIFFFLLSIYFNYKNVIFIKNNGYMYMYYWVPASISKKIQEIISFVIYLQVSLGDMYIRNHLSRVETQFMICFSVISFYTGLFEIILGNFQAPRYILQAFAYLFIFIAINFTSTFLSARMAEENLSYHVAELYKKYDIYKKYRLLFFAVILKPILLVIYKVLCLSPSSIDLCSSHEYFYVFFDLLFDVILYFILFLLFRPAKPIKLLKHVLSSEEFHID